MFQLGIAGRLGWQGDGFGEALQCQVGEIEGLRQLVLDDPGLADGSFKMLVERRPAQAEDVRQAAGDDDGRQQQL